MAGYIGSKVVSLSTDASDISGNITVGGTVDGRDVSVDGTKLDGVEASATADQTKADIEGLGIDLPAANLTGTVAAARLDTATTQAESDDSTKIATTAYVVDKITTLIGGAPSTLNDLNELAAAINDDANYNSTLTTALGTKMPKAGGDFTGAITGTTASFTRLDINATNTQLKGDLFANTDGAFDIGASGANRPRNLYLSNSIVAADITTTGTATAGTLKTTAGGTVTTVSGNDLNIVYPAGRSLFIKEGSETHVAVDNAGNVGIGTATFGATYDKLAVAGGINIQDDYAGKLEIGRYSSGVPNSYIKLGANSNSLRFTNKTDSADLLTIENGGNVGIGTTSPARPLNIVDDAGANPIQSIRNSNVSWGQYALTRYGAESEDLRYMDFGYYRGSSELTRGLVIKSQSNSTLVTFLDSGNVGIGCTPLSSLHVSSAGDTSITLQTTNAVDNNEIWQIQAAGNASNYADLIFRTRTNAGSGGSERFRIDSSGNLVRPNHKIHMAATVGYNTTYDTGISVNGNNYGKTLLVFMSGHVSNGMSTHSSLSLVRCGYDGNNTPVLYNLGGNITPTVGKSASNTVTLHTPSLPIYQIMEIAGIIG